MTKEKEAALRESLDRTGRLITNAAMLSEGETNKIATAPYLWARIRTRIAEEEQLRDSQGLWSGIWLISKRAIPAMMIVAALSFGLSVYMAGNKTQSTVFSVDAYLGTNDSGLDNMMFAESRPLTRDEVLATIITKDDREAGR